MQKSIGKWEIRPPVKSYPVKYHLETLHTRYVGEVTRHANFCFNRYSGASPQIGEILLLCDFFDCHVLSCPYMYLFSRSCARSNSWTDFHALWLKRRVSAQGWSFWGLERWWPYLEEVRSQNPPKWAWIGKFKQKRQNMKIAISPKL